MTTLTTSRAAAATAAPPATCPRSRWPGRQEQRTDVPERHHPAGHPGAVGAGLQRGSRGQAQHDRVDEDGDGELDADHDADDGCGDNGERGKHDTPHFLALLDI